MTFSEEQLEKLSQPLDPDRISQRQGPGGKKLDYIEGWYAIQQANEIFGYDGWQSEITSLTQVGQGFLCELRVTVTTEDSITTHSDVGFGPQGDPEFAVKTAATDALKRALRYWGPQFGLSLYDKDADNHPDQAATGSTQGQQRRSEGGDDRKVTEAQVKRLWAIVASKGIPREKVKEVLESDYRVADAKDLTRDDYDKLCTRLENATPVKPAEPEQPPLVQAAVDLGGVVVDDDALPFSQS